MFEKPDHEERAPAAVQPVTIEPPSITRSSEVEELPVPRPPSDEAVTPLPSEKITVIGSDVTFKGELIAGAEVYVHGTVEGSIARHTKKVVVGKKGRVKALVHADSVRIQGQVDGDIYGDELVELMEGAAVNGNIFCARVKIEPGAKFNGTVTMS